MNNSTRYDEFKWIDGFVKKDDKTPENECKYEIIDMDEPVTQKENTDE